MKNKSKFFSKGVFALFLFLYAAAIIIGTFWDLQISQAVANPSCVWAKILEIIGEPPSLLFVGFHLAIVYTYVHRFRIRCAKIAKIFCIIAMEALFVYTILRTITYCYHWTENATQTIGIPTIVVAFGVGIGVSILFLWIAGHFSDDTLHKIGRIAAACILAGAVVLFVISLLKMMWGRFRYREMVALGTFEAYTPWYRIGGMTGHNSFPSGHTANAALISMVALYPIKKWQKLVLFLWIGVVSYSRIAVGAHFLTDVLFGGGISLFIVWLAKKWATL